MKEKQWVEIYNRIKSEHPNYGYINLVLTWHDGRLARYEFKKSDVILVREVREEEDENGNKK